MKDRADNETVSLILGVIPPNWESLILIKGSNPSEFWPIVLLWYYWLKNRSFCIDCWWLGDLDLEKVSTECLLGCNSILFLCSSLFSYLPIDRQLFCSQSCTTTKNATINKLVQIGSFPLALTFLGNMPNSSAVTMSKSLYNLVTLGNFFIL